MKFKRLLVSMLAVGALTFGFAGQAQTASASINSDAKKKTYRGTKYLKDLLKAAGMTYNQFNSVANGKEYGSRFGYRNGVGKPEGVVVHETATPGANAWAEGRYFNNNWMTAYTYVHAVVDNTQTIQLMSTDYGVWGAGPIANQRYIQIELCEVSTRSQFVQSVANDAYYIAQLLHSYNLTPSRANKNGSGTIWSHNEVSHYLGGTDHGYPDGYFAKWGYSMSDFYSLITYYYNKQGGSSSNSSSSSSSSKKPASQAASAVKKRLMRNTYTYNGQGQKATSIAKFKAGSYLMVYGSAVTIGNTKFYRYGTNKYVKADSIDGTVKTLKHNAYVYSAAGSRIKTEATRKKWTRVTAYGSAITIKGKKYYMIGFSGNTALYLKAGNF